MSALKTLLHIDVLLRIYWCPTRFEMSPDIFEDLIAAELIQGTDSNWFKATDRGRIYCEALREVPLPVKKWSMP